MPRYLSVVGKPVISNAAKFVGHTVFVNSQAADISRLSQGT